MIAIKKIDDQAKNRDLDRDQNGDRTTLQFQAFLHVHVLGVSEIVAGSFKKKLNPVEAEVKNRYWWIHF